MGKMHKGQESAHEGSGGIKIILSLALDCLQ